jgi:DNA-binding NtrC family response regulator
VSGAKLVGSAEAIRLLADDVELAGRSEAKVLITGESGVGKEVVARLIHDGGSRARQPMITINCAGIPDTLLASELFGHARGSFTDAHRDRTGWLEQAHRGTVFLDEIGEMSLQMQALLLRFLENGEIQRVGSEIRNARVDVRVICATHRNLLECVRNGEFREDLYYRLNVIHIAIPPLRHRRGDIPELIEHFANHFASVHRGEVPRVSPEAMALLCEHHWPGNIRELRNVVERLVLRWRSGDVTPADLPRMLVAGLEKPVASVQNAPTVSRVQLLYDAMTDRGETFWQAVYVPFKSRDLTREDLRSLVRIGLATTRGNYKLLVRLFNMPDVDYKRFLNFLRKHDAHLPIHEFRAIAPRRAVAADKDQRAPLVAQA